MLEKIVIPVDGSPRAEAILWQTARLLRRRESHFIFVRAIEPYFKELMERLPVDQVRVSGVIREGYPADVILHVAREEKATMIAMSTHGRTGLAR